jgi:hypothetical protein
MKANKFNKIDNTFFLIEEKTKKVCMHNNIEFYNYLGVFVNLLNNYVKKKHNIEVVKNCDFNDKISTRAILNKAYFSSKEVEINFAIENFELSKKNMFTWLDNTKTPYFFILNPVFNYGAGIEYNSYFVKTYGYLKEKLTGMQNLDIASDYADYKIKTKHSY